MLDPQLKLRKLLCTLGDIQFSFHINTTNNNNHNSPSHPPQPQFKPQPDKTPTMTTYIPSLTFPEHIFTNLPVSVLLPIGLGSAVGYATKRMYLPIYQSPLKTPFRQLGEKHKTKC
jgi:hypothetical protein